MRLARPACLAIMLMLSGCERSFEQRYDEVETEVKAEAHSIDKDMEAQAAKRAPTARKEGQRAEK